MLHESAMHEIWQIWIHTKNTKVRSHSYTWHNYVHMHENHWETDHIIVETSTYASKPLRTRAQITGVSAWNTVVFIKHSIAMHPCTTSLTVPPEDGLCGESWLPSMTISAQHRPSSLLSCTTKSILRAPGRNCGREKTTERVLSLPSMVMFDNTLSDSGHGEYTLDWRVDGLEIEGAL